MQQHAGAAPCAAVLVASPTGPSPALAGRNHPLAIERVATVMELARLLGWLAAGGMLDAETAISWNNRQCMCG